MENEENQSQKPEINKTRAKFKTKIVFIAIACGLFLLSVIGVGAYWLGRQSVNKPNASSCGDGICQSITCQAIGCPEAETHQNCPQDCKSQLIPLSPTAPTVIPINQNGKEQSCINSGGTITTSLCCSQAADFPNTCIIGACGCGPDDSRQVKICQCPDGQCFDGEKCSGSIQQQTCRPTNGQCLAMEIDETYYYYNDQLEKCVELQALCNGTRFNTLKDCEKNCIK